MKGLTRGDFQAQRDVLGLEYAHVQRTCGHTLNDGVLILNEGEEPGDGGFIVHANSWI